MTKLIYYDATDPRQEPNVPKGDAMERVREKDQVDWFKAERELSNPPQDLLRDGRPSLSIPKHPLPALATPFKPERTVTPRPSLIVVGDDPLADLCASGPLTASHTIQRAATLDAARLHVRSLQRGIVATELRLPDGDGVEICKAAKSASRAVLVLVTTTDVTSVPRALTAGCDSVLLKPFAPNLLYARLGRLSRDLLTRTAFPAATLEVGTNRHWPAVACPGCGRLGATSFDATSLRRSWYACLACEHVWIAKRQQ
jgi:CheY-like chemotaxis protein